MAFPRFPGPAAAQAIALLAQLDASQWWSLDRLRTEQLAQLQQLVLHAGATTAWGREHVSDVTELTWERWAQVPVLPRSVVQRQPERLRSDRPPPSHGPIVSVHSSGSTSVPVAVDRTALSGTLWHAIHTRDHLWHGRDTAGLLAAVRHEPTAHHGLHQPAWGPMLATLGHTGPCRVLHIGATTSEQARWLAEQDAAYLLMYPSSLRDLLQHCPTPPCPGLRAVLTFGEVVDDALRERLRSQWGLEIQDVYSAQEVGYLALQCPDHPVYHVQSETMLVELVRPDGSPSAPGERGRVIVTPLHDFAMPLLRYDLGDFAVAGPPCPCGRGLPVIERILGRVHETFETADGERIWLTVGVHLLPTLGPVAQHQFVQHAPGTLEARFVAHRPPTDAETAALEAHLRGRLPAGTLLTVCWVDRIERTSQGKFQSFVSALPTR